VSDPVFSPLRPPVSQETPNSTFRSAAVVESSVGPNVHYIDVTGDPLDLFASEPDTPSRTLEQPDIAIRTREPVGAAIHAFEQPEPRIHILEPPDTAIRTFEQPDAAIRTLEHPDAAIRTLEQQVRHATAPPAPKTSIRESLAVAWTSASPGDGVARLARFSRAGGVNVAFALSAILMAGIGAFWLTGRRQPADDVKPLTVTSVASAASDIALEAEQLPATGAAPAAVATMVRHGKTAFTATPSTPARRPESVSRSAAAAETRALQTASAPPPVAAMPINAVAAPVEPPQAKPQAAVVAQADAPVGRARTPVLTAPSSPIASAPSAPSPSPALSTSSASFPGPASSPTAALPVRPLYGPSDDGVEPPSALQPSLMASLAPNSPNVRLDALLIAVVIGANGTVESVKALNPPQTMSEAVLVTAALSGVKSWRFRPAMKDSVPVRYREVVPLGTLVRSPQ